MRRITLLSARVFLLASLVRATAEETPPLIEVLIVGVPSTQVSQYQGSPLGDEAVKVCSSLSALFSGPNVHVTPMCTVADTTYDHVYSTLSKHFHGPNRHRISLLFVMTHGETTEDGDVRLLMSDTRDDNKDDHSIRIRENLVTWLSNASDSVAIGFIDACFSGAALNYRVMSLGAAAEKEGVHAGILASAQGYQQSFNLSFTKALIDTWKSDCPSNPDDFISAVLGRMESSGSSGSTPLWLIPYHGSGCFGELLRQDKRVMVIWRDSHKKVLVSLFDDSAARAKPLRIIPPGVDYVMPYAQVLVPGRYRIETRDEVDQAKLLDKSYCDFSEQSHCEYSFPTETTPLISLNLSVAVYGAASSVGYSDDQLKEILAKTVSSYKLVTNENERIEAAKLVGASPDLASAVLEQNLRPGMEPIEFASASQESQAWNHIANRVNELDELNASTSKIIKDVDARAQQGVVAAAASATEADNRAIEAGEKAQQAKQLAALSNTRMAALEQSIQNLDSYQVSTQLSITIPRNRQNVLPQEVKSKLQRFTEPLKQSKGYIIEVQAFSSVTGQSDLETSQRTADAVVRYLVSECGVPLYRIRAIGMGNSRKIALEQPHADTVELTVLQSD
jgi:outer membrane protein OmpA-like peptidoglycan-associated protein